MRLAPNSPVGVDEKPELTNTSQSHCLRTFPRGHPRVLVLG